MTCKNYNTAIFDATLKEALLLYTQRLNADIPPKDELDKLYPPSERQKIQLQKLFIADKQRQLLKKMYGGAKRAAATAAVITAVLFGAFMTSQEVRAAVTSAVVEWYDKFVSIISPVRAVSNFNPSAWEFEMPQGFVVIDESITDIHRVVFCESENGDNFTLTISPANASAYMNSENSHYKEMEINGVQYWLFVSGKDENVENRIHWNINDASFLVSTNLPEANMIKIAQSVRLKSD